MSRVPRLFLPDPARRGQRTGSVLKISALAMLIATPRTRNAPWRRATARSGEAGEAVSMMDLSAILRINPTDLARSPLSLRKLLVISRVRILRALGTGGSNRTRISDGGYPVHRPVRAGCPMEKLRRRCFLPSGLGCLTRIADNRLCVLVRLCQGAARLAQFQAAVIPFSRAFPSALAAEQARPGTQEARVADFRQEACKKIWEIDGEAE